MLNAPELLAPAGTLKAMRYAFAYGADAVYAGQPRYSLRVRENDFHNPEVMAEGIKEAPLFCLVPMCLTALGCPVLFFYADELYELLLPLVSS